MIIFKDISNNIERSLVDLLADVDAACRLSGIGYFLLGATARDLYFDDIFNIQTRRATLDVDIAIRVRSWDEYHELTTLLVASKNFTRDAKIQHQFKHRNSVLADFLPFGEIENPRGSISWPSEEGRVMHTVGFDEAFRGSVVVRIRTEPELNIRLAVPAAIALQKIVVWDEMYPGRNDDAKDLLFLMEEYINAGNGERLYNEDKDLAEDENFDYGLASPRLLGRDIAKLASPSIRSVINAILENEVGSDSQFRLIHDMIGGRFDAGEAFEKTLVLLKQLKLGFQDRKGM